MSADPHPTVRDLAAQLGLSRTTVAAALRRHPSVAAATRERVLAAAAKKGYQPNALVSALMSQVRQRRRLQPTGEVVMFLTAFPRESDWKGMPSVVQQYEGARQRATELGFDLQFMWLGDRGSQSRVAARVLHARAVRGSLLAPLPMDHHILELAWSDHTVIAIGYSFSQMALHRVANHNMNMMFACYANLRRLGHRRIGLAIHRLDDSRVHHFWLAGFLGAQRVHGGDFIEPLLLDDYVDPEPFHRWMETCRPDAVIGIWGHKTLDWLRERGHRVPEDVAYASLDLGEGNVGRIAGILQDHHAMGMAAMDLLAGNLFRNDIGIPTMPRVTMIEGTWTDGPTASRRD